MYILTCSNRRAMKLITNKYEKSFNWYYTNFDEEGLNIFDEIGFHINCFRVRVSSMFKEVE